MFNSERWRQKSVRRKFKFKMTVISKHTQKVFPRPIPNPLTNILQYFLYKYILH
jgi:hypothetical protein